MGHNLATCRRRTRISVTANRVRVRRRIHTVRCGGWFVFVCRRRSHQCDGRADRRDGEQGKVKSVKMNGQTKRGGLEPKSHSLFLPVWVSGEKGPRKAKFFFS